MRNRSVDEMAGLTEGGRRDVLLNLFNFDAPEHASSRYVLTSPRSLKACARLGIRPVELMPRKAVGEGVGLRGGAAGAAIKERCEHEVRRKAKLQAARRERERIIKQGQEEEADGKGTRMQTEQASSSQQANKQKHSVEEGLSRALLSRYREEEQWRGLQAATRQLWEAQAARERERREGLRKQHQRKVAEAWQTRQQRLARREGARRREEEAAWAEGRALADAREERRGEVHVSSTARKLRDLHRHRTQEEHRKRMQEQKLMDIELEEAARRSALQEHIAVQEELASSNRDTWLASHSHNRQQSREERLCKVQENKSQLREADRRDADTLRLVLEEKQALSSQLQQALASTRQTHLEHTAELRKQKMAQTQAVAKQLEQDMEQWKADTAAHNQKRMEHACKEAGRRREGVRGRVGQERREKETRQQLNLHRVERECEERALQMALYLEQKRARSEELTRARESAVMKSREQVCSEEVKRDQLRRQYSRNSFDKLVLEAELRASLERRGTKPSIRPTA